MQDSYKQDNINGKSFLATLTEAFGWLQILASPVLFAGITGFLIYKNRPSQTRLLLAIGITGIGLFVGIIWATRVWKKRGTVNFMSRVSGSGDPDQPDNK